MKVLPHHRFRRSHRRRWKKTLWKLWVRNGISARVPYIIEICSREFGSPSRIVHHLILYNSISISWIIAGVEGRHLYVVILHLVNRLTSYLSQLTQ